MRARAETFGFISCVIFFSLALVPYAVSAHGAGLTFTATTSNAIIDVDYQAYSIVAGDLGRFDLRLFKDAARIVPVAFDNVWVRISKVNEPNPDRAGETLFSGLIAKPEFGGTGFSILIPESGPYTMLVRYSMGDTEISEATLLFTVEPPYREEFRYGREFWFGLAGGAAAIALAFGLYLFTRRRR